MSLSRHVANYLDEYKNEIEEHYRWPFDTDLVNAIFNIQIAGKTSLQKNRALRIALRG